MPLAPVPFGKEILNESVAGFTDSVATQFFLVLCHYIYTEYESLIQPYFISPVHLYWIFYFIHVGIIDSYIWGATYRNSLIYIFARSASQSKVRTLCVCLTQYASIFAGAWCCCQCVEFVLSDDPHTAKALKLLFVGPADLAGWDSDRYILFVWQSLLFQVADRLLNGLVVTVSPVLKRRTTVLDGGWIQVTFRCLLMHWLIVHKRYYVIVNPNYGFYGGLYHWRCSLYDLIILSLPYASIVLWNCPFRRLPFLHNPNYFAKKKRKRKRKKRRSSQKTKKKD